MTRPMDYTPIIPGTDEDPQRDEEALRPIPKPAHLTMVEEDEILGDALHASTTPVEYPSSTSEERIARLESTVAVLWKAIAALEQKIGVR